MDSTGQCLCGAVTFSAKDIDPHMHACHCTMCRKWSGGPGFAIGVGSVEFNGEANITAFASSDWAERGFCNRCGTNLFYRMPQTGMTMLWAGSLDNNEDFDLTGEIYVDEKPAGYNFAGDHPRQTGPEFLASMGVEIPEG